MASFEVESANILNKIVFLEKYLGKYEKEDLKEGKGIEKEKINEDELVELAANFDETKDLEQLNTSLKNLHEMMDLDGDGKFSNEELKKFEEIIKQMGFSAGEMLSLYNEYNMEVSDDVDFVKIEDLKDVDIDKFKEIIADYPKLKEIIEEVGYEEFFKLLDTDNSGTLEDSELEAISNLDKDDSNFSFDDIKAVLDENDVEVTDKAEEVKASIEEIKSEQELFDKLREALGMNNPIQMADTSSAAPMGSYPAGGSSGGSYGNYSGGNNGGLNGAGAASNADTIKQLEEERDVKKGELTTLKGNLEAALDGSDPEIKDKKDDMDEKEETYKELLESEAESNEVVKGYKDELEENEKNIEENEKNIKEAELKLNDAEMAISDQEIVISGLESDKKALEDSLAALDKITVTDKNKSEIEDKRREINGKITAKQTEIDKAKEKLTELEGNRDDAKDELDELKDLQKTLEETRDDLEKKLEEVVSDTTKEALHAFQEARETYESAKDSRVETVKGEITTKETEISEIEGKIQVLRAEEIKKENEVGPLARYNAQRGQALADAAESLYGNVSKGGGWCATGVSRAINKAFGYSTSGNGCDYGNTMSALSDWTEITDYITSPSQLVDLPAGAIVSWSPYNTTSLGSIYGHVYIADGKGHEISDFKGNITTYYADRGGKYRVFIPT